MSKENIKTPKSTAKKIVKFSFADGDIEIFIRDGMLDTFLIDIKKLNIKDRILCHAASDEQEMMLHVRDMIKEIYDNSHSLFVHVNFLYTTVKQNFKTDDI